MVSSQKFTSIRRNGITSYSSLQSSLSPKRYLPKHDSPDQSFFCDWDKGHPIFANFLITDERSQSMSVVNCDYSFVLKFTQMIELDVIDKSWIAKLGSAILWMVSTLQTGSMWRVRIDSSWGMSVTNAMSAKDEKETMVACEKSERFNALKNMNLSDHIHWRICQLQNLSQSDYSLTTGWSMWWIPIWWGVWVECRTSSHQAPEPRSPKLRALLNHGSSKSH